MGFSTIAELRLNIKSVDSDEYSDANVTSQIAQADEIIKQDVGNYITVASIPDTGDSPATPFYINRLSQYKTAELVLIALHGASRKAEDVSDIMYWQKQYSNPNPIAGERIGLLEQIQSGSIELVLSDGTNIGKGGQRFVRDAKDGIEPAMGLNDFGEFRNNTELLKDRPERD
jgi:hypothetical protein